MLQKRICIIDDDPIYKLITKKLIQKTKLYSETIEFNNGNEAIIYFEATSDLPDILLLDIEMPEMDGWEFLDEFCKLEKRINKESTVYIASSSIAIEDKLKAKEYKCVKEFLSKPINLDKLQKIAEQN
ncbi:Response regulator receiver domain-containing protein [Flavobacterium swingsii]|jgi:CheY-like chemotaxis protein|uniref:Response regulator receiver domain-containing protein n=1 Tax=Flavobacterium swingsii TaxID=498292 RepID=A0A1I0WBM0_9FLAO|nr:response regulator [Flavobacterium swingsii]SFA86145.1 Response regulator receiver domain-containing protein [Flavobacterium swingsii]